MISFKWRQFKKNIILMSVRWYLAYSLSYRNIEEMMLERRIYVDHSTMNRWVVFYSEKLESSFSRCHKRRVGLSCRMDETYIKIKGKLCYLYRAVDKAGKTIEFMVSKKAAKVFFNKAMGSAERPEKITMDKSGSNKSALDTINKTLPKNEKIRIRQIKYLNNIVEKEDRFIKKLLSRCFVSRLCI